jgi:hypothetical protein
MFTIRQLWAFILTNMEGWISLHRKITEHWIFEDPEKFKAWIIMLMSVNHSEKKVNIGNELFTCKRGESLNSLDTWMELFGKKWNKSKVRRFFDLLEKDSMIVRQTNPKTTHLTICKYEDYQGGRHADDTQMTSKRHADDIQTTPNNNDNNEDNDNNDNNSKPKKKFKKPSIEEIEEYCQERENNVDSNKFFDHYESNGWMVGRNKMKNWQASVRTWEKNTTQSKKEDKPFIVNKDVGCDSSYN